MFLDTLTTDDPLGYEALPRMEPEHGAEQDPAGARKLPAALRGILLLREILPSAPKGMAGLPHTRKAFMELKRQG